MYYKFSLVRESRHRLLVFAYYKCTLFWVNLPPSEKTFLEPFSICFLVKIADFLLDLVFISELALRMSCDILIEKH